MSNELINLLLSENKAYWYKDSGSLVLLPDGFLTREWRNIPVEHRNACIAALRARRKEVNPSAQQVPYSGTYRITKIEDVVEKDAAGRSSSITIREFLASGLASSLADATLTPARVPSWTANPGGPATQAASVAHPSGTSSVQQPYETIILRWENLDPNALESVDAGRTSITETTLTVNGESMAGPWYNTSRRRGQVDDGSGFYEETWGLAGITFEAVECVGDMAVVANRYIQNVPKNLVKSTLDAEITALGATYGAAGYVYRQRIRWRDELADLELDVVHNVAKTDTHTSEDSDVASTERTVYKSGTSLPDAVDSLGVVQVIRGDIGSDGLVDYTKEVITSKEQVIAEFTNEAIQARTTTEKIGKNLRSESGYAPIAYVQGHTKRLEKSKNADGTLDLRMIDSLAVDQTGSVSGASDSRSDSDAATVDTVRHTAVNAPEVDVAFSIIGTLVETQNTPNPDGTFETVKKSTVSKEQEILATVTSVDQFKASQINVGKNIKDANLAAHYAVASSQAAGVIENKQISKNADATYDVSKEVVTAKAVSSTTVTGEIRKFESIESVQNRNQSAGETVPSSQSVGTIVTVKNQKNEFQLFDTEKETRSAVGVDDANIEKTVNKFETTASNTDVHATAAITPAGSQTPGKIVTTESQADDFGRFTNREVIRESVSVEDSNTEKTVNKFETVTSNTDVHAISKMADPVQEDGKIKSVETTQDEFGRFTNKEVVRTAIAVVDVVKRKEINKFETDTEVVNRHAANAITEETVQTAGKIVQTTSEKDEFGRFTNSNKERVSASVEDAVKETSATALYVSETVVDRNAATAITPVTSQVVGTIKTAKSAANEFGKFDNTEETRTATAIEDTQATESNAWSDTSTVKKRNAALLETATGRTVGTIVRTGGNRNEFGKYDTEKETITAKDASTTLYSNFKSPDFTSSIQMFKNAATPPALNGSEYGEVRYEKNQFDLYDGYKTTRNYTVDTVLYFPYTGLTEKHIQSRNNPSDGTKDQKRLITSTFNIGYYATQGAAYNAISGGYDGSHIAAVAKNVWMAKKVTSVVATAWSAADDGSYSYT